MKQNKSSEASIQSLSRAMELLEFIIRSPAEHSVNELAERMGLHVSTVSRLLSTLQAHGFLIKNQETGRYIGGCKILELSALVMKKIKLRDVAFPFLYKLMEDSGETVNLAILDGTRAIFIESVENSSMVTTSSRIGRQLPLHCTAAGKILLAFMDEPDRVLDMLDLKPFTAKTLTSLEAFRDELIRIKKEGYAVDDEEQEVGLRCIAAPIRNHHGKVVAAVSVSGPTIRLSDERTNEVIPIVLQAGQDISRQLGYTASR